MTKKIAICGSMSALSKMIQLRETLSKSDYQVEIPEQREVAVDYEALSDNEIAELKNKFLKSYLRIIINADIVIAANTPKNQISGYIGSNTLIELAFAFAHNKEIYLLHSPGEQPCKSEVLGMMPVVLDGDMTKLIRKKNAVIP